MTNWTAFQHNSPHRTYAHTHQTLCCRITTFDFLHFYHIFKFSDFNKELTSSLKMIWIMIETCWSVLNVLILAF